MTEAERRDLEAQLDEVWELIRELETVSTRLNRASEAAIEALGLRDSYDRGEDE